MCRKTIGFVSVVALVLALVPGARAQIYSEDFNGLTGLTLNGAPAGQITTTHDLGVFGNLAGWSKAGAGTIHAVDTANTWPGPTGNPVNWGVMIWQDNVITQNAGISGSNDNGTQYRIDFLGAGAVYENAGQVNNGTTDGLKVEVLRASDSAVLHTFTQVVAQPVGVGNLGLTAYSFIYTGDGSGDIKFRIGPIQTVGRFQGTIDDLTLSVPAVGGPIGWSAEATSAIDTNSALASATVDTNLTETVLVWDTSDQGTGSTNDWTFRQSLGPTNAGAVSGQLTSLAADTQYTWRFYGTNATTNGWCDATTFRTALGAAQTPVFTNATASIGRITLGWQDNTANETGYILRRSTSAGGPYATIATLGADTVTYSDSPLSAGTYHYRLAATNSANGSATDFADCETNATVVTEALFAEDFEAITGLTLNGSPNGQFLTTHDLGVNGDLAGWAEAGAGTIHAVDTANTWTGGAVSSNPKNWGVMIWQDNVITLSAGIPDSNDSGVHYYVDFLAAGATYSGDQRNNGTTDGLKVEVLRASDNAVLHTFNEVTAQPVGVGNLGLTAASYSYTGDGSGDIKFRIGPINAGQGRFQGTIDDLMLYALPASKLVFTTQPGSGVAGDPLSAQPVVEVQDVNGNKVPTNGATVTVAIDNNPGPGVLSGTTTEDTVSGVADFSGNALSIDTAGNGYTLVASFGALTSATSAAFNVSAGVGPPAKLAFTTQPGGGANHVVWGTQPAVTLQDAAGLTVLGVTTNVTVAILNNAGPGGVLSGTLTQAVNPATGVATFSGLSIDVVGSGYTLEATTAGGLTSGASDAFDITVGPAAKLAFTTQPGDSYAGSALTTQPAVTLQDAYGYTVLGTAQNVTLAIQNNAGPGGVLSGTLTQPVDTGTGIATFSGLSIDKAGLGYTLTATGNTVETTPGVVVSSGFNITAFPGVIWSLADNFSYDPANNSASSTWSFWMENPAGTYNGILLTDNTRTTDIAWGSPNWDYPVDPVLWGTGAGFWGIGKNASGSLQTSPYPWPDGEVRLHPANPGQGGSANGNLVVSWLAPFDCTVDIDYSFSNVPNDGNGVAVGIFHNSSELRALSNPGLAGDSATISGRATTAGDRLFFIYNIDGNAGNDVTRTAITITTMDRPPDGTLFIIR